MTLSTLVFIGVVMTAIGMAAAIVAAFCSYYTMMNLAKKADSAAVDELVNEVEGALKENKGAHRLTEVRSAQVTPISIPDPRALLFPPPMVGTQTLKHWLMYSHRDDGVWTRVVHEFYARAASDHKVRPYFEGYDLDDIKRKFLHTLMIVTDIGVTRAAAEGLIQRHSKLNISGEAYDATMVALTKTFNDFGVPQAAVDQMVPMLEALRKGMVKA